MTFTVKNNRAGAMMGDFQVTCGSGSSQVTCTTVPSSFDLAALQTTTVTATYSLNGMGHFRMNLTAHEANSDSTVTVDAGPLTVVGSPIAEAIAPVDGSELNPTDSLIARMYSPGGINVPSVHVLIDGVFSNNNGWRINDTIVSSTYPPPAYSAGPHLWSIYVCANSGRCDSVTTAFKAGVGLAWNLDDSLPAPAGVTGFGTQLGGLPLPPTNLRGCPQVADNPEITLFVGGAGVGPQMSNDSNYNGLVFFAGVGLRGDTVVINTVTHDYKASDNHTCAAYIYAPKFDWTFWTEASKTDSLWNRYPYGDGAPMAFVSPSQSDDDEAWGLANPVAGMEREEGAEGFATLLRAASLWGNPRDSDPPATFGRDSHITRRIPSAEVSRSFWTTDPGAINPSTLNLWFNGTQIVQNGVALNGATIKVNTRSGATVALPVSSSRVHKYNYLNPNTPADSGGWNEVKASISDSTNHTTTTRARYVQLVPGVPGSIVVAALHNFQDHDEGNCAAFGSFQCDGVVAVSTIPTFVSRDRARDLHLIYRSASQRAQTQVPLSLSFNRYNKAPNTLDVVPYENSVRVGDTLRYAGLDSMPAGSGVFPLSEDFNEIRVVSTEITPALTTQATVRHVSIGVTQRFFTPPTTSTQTLSQDLIQLYLTDTTSTRFGAGWQLAELSRLVTGNLWQGDSAIIHVDGDGSYQVFTRLSAGNWRKPPGSNDTLVVLSTMQSDSTKYIVYLDNGARLGYRVDGWPSWTSDLIGNLTTYTWSSTGRRLTQIADPTGAKLLFTYNSAGRVTSVEARPMGASTGRTVAWLAYDGSAHLRSVSLPGAGTTRDSVRFGYESGAAFTSRGAFLDSIIDPRDRSSQRIVTTYAYEQGLFTPISATRPKDATGTASSWFRTGWRRAAPRVNYGRGMAQVRERMVYYNQMMGTFVDGTDNATDFAIDAFGGPTYVRRISPIAWVGGFLPSYDDTRRIDRDSLGRVITIVHAPDEPTISDSVRFHYNAVTNRVDKMWRTSLSYPVATTDSVTLDFSMATVAATGARCMLFWGSTDPMGGAEGFNYPNTTDASKCLPQSATSLGGDLTWFTYGSLTPGTPSTTRPTLLQGNYSGVSTSIKYDSTTWNTSGYRRSADSFSVVLYDPFGRVSQYTDPVGIVSRFVRDSAGRVTHAKTGTGIGVPTIRHRYGVGGLDSVSEVYATSNDLALDTPAGSPAIQATKMFYSTLGQVDSVLGPGTRPTSRKQSYRYDRLGQRNREYPGNGALSSQIHDWRGLVTQQVQSRVSIGGSYDGEAFALGANSTYYGSIGMSDSKTLSAGQETDYTYDGKSRLIFSSTLDFYLGKTLDRTLEYKQSGLPITETLSYADSFAVVRHFAYNRRGQRTMVVDTVRLKSTGQILPEGVDSSVYVYDSLTSLLTTVSATVDSSGTKCNYARVHYLYDNAGRETRDTVKAANCSGGAAGSTVTDLTYDDRGRVSQKTVSVNGATVYSYGALTYKHGGGADELIGYTGVIPTEPFSLGQGLDYDTAGTRRLIQSSGRDGVAQSYRYDTFGNRVSQWSSGGCAYHDTLTYDPASNAIQTRVNTGCTRNTTFYTDHAGSRLAEQDNTSGGANTNRMSYTAGGQLYFSYVWSGVNLPKRYNYTWNWYDGEGRRIIAHSRNGTGDVTAATAPDSGIRTFYVYDGSDVALAIVNGSPGTWAIRQRYLNGGLDHQLAMRTRQGATGYPKTLALISDYQGSLIGAFNTSGVIDPQVVNFKADPFGTVTQAFDQYDGPVNPEVGYTGAATTNSTAGFVYLRNRWYDPQTGRFLTQDPIGLAGGVNLYAYAGNNPIAYSDPFGLGPNCNATTGLAMAICVAATALEGIVKNVESHGLGPSMDQLSPEMAPEGSASTAIANGVKTGGRFETFYGTTGAMQPPNPTRGAAPSRIGDQGTGRLPVPGIRGGVLGAIVLLLIPDLQTQPAVICLKEGCGPQDPPPTIGPQPNR